MRIAKQLRLLTMLILAAWMSSACGGILATDDSPQSNAEASDESNLTSTRHDGSSRNKPAPLGYSIVEDNVEVTVLGVVRGQVDDVRSSISESSLRYASSRPPSQAWVIVSLKLRNVGSSDSLVKTYSASDFNLIDSQGDLYPANLLIETNNPLSSVILGLPVGSEVQGDIVFHVGEDDESAVLRYLPLLRFLSKPKYLALTEP